MTIKTWLTGSALLVLVGCGGGGGTGDLALVLGAEETIAEGIAAGTEDEDITDGWSVQFDSFVVAIGDVRVGRSGSSDLAEDATVHVVDLVQLPPSGLALTSFTGLPAERWDLLSYALVTPTLDAVVASGVSQGEYEAMVAGGCTYSLSGTIVPAGGTGMSNPPGGTPRVVDAEGVAFAFCVPAPVRFERCELDGVPGVAIPSGGSASAELTFHGDHMFFTSFIEGAEIVNRRAQWLVDGDTNGDGTVTRAELEGVVGANLAAMFPADLDPGTPGNQGYSLVGAPGGVITNAFAYLVAQLRTQGHLNGEGECVPRVP